jgi:hypothetical protein
MALENIDARQVFQYLEDFGFFEVVLPFLLVFSITFALLEKIGLFARQGTQSNKGVNIIVSFIAAFLFVRNITLIEFVQNLVPATSMILLVALMFIMVAGIFTSSGNWTGAVLSIAMVVAIIALIWSMVYYADTDLGVDLPSFDFSDRDWVILVFLAAFVIGLILTIGKRPGNIGGGLGKVLQGIDKGFGGGGSPP